MKYVIHVLYYHCSTHIHMYMYTFTVQLTSVFKDRPLLKKIVETAMYFTVISGRKGPVAYKYGQKTQ